MRMKSNDIPTAVIGRIHAVPGVQITHLNAKPSNTGANDNLKILQIFTALSNRPLSTNRATDSGAFRVGPAKHVIFIFNKTKLQETNFCDKPSEDTIK